MTTSEPTTGEIVRDLRRCFNEKSFGCVDCACRISSVEHFCDYDKIADRLESQERTIADKDAKIAELTARAESAERERDAIVKSVDDLAEACENVKAFEVVTFFKRWRGLPQEGEGL